MVSMKKEIVKQGGAGNTGTPPTGSTVDNASVGLQNGINKAAGAARATPFSSAQAAHWQQQAKGRQLRETRRPTLVRAPRPPGFQGPEPLRPHPIGRPISPRPLTPGTNTGGWGEAPERPIRGGREPIPWKTGGLQPMMPGPNDPRVAGLPYVRPQPKISGLPVERPIKGTPEPIPHGITPMPRPVNNYQEQIMATMRPPQQWNGGMQGQLTATRERMSNPYNRAQLQSQRLGNSNQRISRISATRAALRRRAMGG